MQNTYLKMVTLQLIQMTKRATEYFKCKKQNLYCIGLIPFLKQKNPSLLMTGNFLISDIEKLMDDLSKYKTPTT